MKRSNITVIIPTKNEQDLIAECIDRAKRLGTVVVVDSHSTDETVDIAKSCGAQILCFQWNGSYPKKRNWTLDNYNFDTDWVLFLDADEFVDEEFCDEVVAATLKTHHAGFWIQYDNLFMGKPLRRGDSLKKLALFKPACGRYERINDEQWSSLDMEVHEHPILAGSTGVIKKHVAHNDDRGLSHYIEKHNQYSTWEARRYALLTSPGNLAQEDRAPGDSLTQRQKTKYKYILRWWFAPAYFFYSYLYKMGFIDGTAGLHFALMKTIYFYQVRLKILENV